MDKNLKQIKPMICPVCGQFYFSELTDVEVEQLGMTPNATQCRKCGWYYDLEQLENPKLERESNEMYIRHKLDTYEVLAYLRYRDSIPILDYLEFYLDTIPYIVLTTFH